MKYISLIFVFAGIGKEWNSQINFELFSDIIYFFHSNDRQAVARGLRNFIYILFLLLVLCTKIDIIFAAFSVIDPVQ